MNRISMSVLNSMNFTAWTDLDRSGNLVQPSGLNIWHRKQRLINVTAVQSNGSPITCQMWDSSMADVAAKVLDWHEGEWHKEIIRIYISDGKDESVASEWVITPSGTEIAPNQPLTSSTSGWNKDIVRIFIPGILNVGTENA